MDSQLLWILAPNLVLVAATIAAVPLAYHLGKWWASRGDRRELDEETGEVRG